MGLKLAADFDLELFFSEFDKRMAKRDQALERYLTRPHADLRVLFQVVNGAAAPVVIDLGAPAGGRLWSVQQVAVMAGVTLTTTAAANVSAAVFVGSIPTGIANNIDVAALRSAPFTVPNNLQAGGKSIICRSQEHLYVVLLGAGTNANAWTAVATVLEIPDTPE